MTPAGARADRPLSPGVTRRSTRSPPTRRSAVAACAELECLPRRRRRSSREGAEPVDYLRVDPLRRGRAGHARQRARPARSRASCSATARCSPGCPTGIQRARRGGHALLPDSRRQAAVRVLSRGPGRRLRGPLAARGAHRAARSWPREPGAPALADQPVGTLLRGEPVVVRARHDDPRGGAADERPGPGAVGRQVDLGRRAAVGILTDRDLRTRVVAGGIERGRSGVGGDVGARPTPPPRPPGGERAARDARPRRAPLPGDLGDAARSLGVVEDIDLVAVRDALLVLPAPADRRRAQRRGLADGRARAAADGRRAARRAGRGRAT